MGQANTAWKQQKHMSKTIYEQMGMSQHEVSFFDPKMVTLKGKKVTSFTDIPKQEKKHVLQQWQWIAFGCAKPAQDEKTKIRRTMKPTNAKTTTQSKKSKNVKTIVQNLTCQLHRL